MSDRPGPPTGGTPGAGTNASPPSRSASERRGEVSTGLLLRRRLLELLGGLKPLTVVSAPAGYGKTILAESWAADAGDDVTVVRVPLEEEDVLPEALWPSLTDALGRAGVLIRHRDGEAGFRDASRGPAKVLADDLEAHGRPVVWILDCGEFSLSPQAGREIDRLIRAAGTTLAVLMLTRHDPALPLHRLRLDGALREVRAEDLAFTAGEVAALMSREGVSLTPPEVSALRTRTGGWPAGLRFAALTLRERADVSGAIEDFRGDTGNVAEYLMSEVLQRQPPGRRRFLLRSCIAEELDPPLVEALTGQHCDVAVLEAMADGDCFVERIPGQHDRFRYHALFRQFLRAQLWFEKSPPTEVLHRVAAEWLAADGQWFLAVRHAVAAKEWTLATRLLVDSLGFVDLLGGSRSQSLKRLFAGLPPGPDEATAALTRAAISLSDLDTTAAGAHLDVARAALAQDPAQVSHASTIAAAVLSALQASASLDTGAALDTGLRTALLAEKALRPLPTQEHPGRRAALAAVVAGSKGRVLFARGDFREATQTFRDGVRAAEAAHLDAVAAELKGMCALVDAVTGNLRRASATATQATRMRAATPDRTPGGTEAATLALAWVRTEEADPVLGKELVTQAKRALLSYDSQLLTVVTALLRARLLTDEGDLRLALAELRVARAELRAPALPDRAAPPGDAGTTDSWLVRSLLLAQADALTGLGRSDDAIAIVRQLGGEDRPRELDAEITLQKALLAAMHPDRDLTRLATARKVTSHDERPLSLEVDRWLLLAEGSISDRDATGGAGYLGQALRLAAPEHLRRPILQAPDHVQELLAVSGLTARNRWLTPPSETTPGVAHRTLHIPEQRQAPRGYDDDVSAPVVIPLTKKETEVLGYLAKLLTTDEIAAVMLVSVNTVRSHVRSILRKLGVSRRNEAVRRAWDLELLPPDSAA